MPHPGGNLTQAGAELQTYYGKVSSHWSINGNSLHVDVEIPANTTATIYLPASSIELIKESNQPLASEKEIISSGREAEYVVLQTGSGSYHFTIGK
jgi:alpha-L-rhamnosidase